MYTEAPLWIVYACDTGVCFAFSANPNAPKTARGFIEDLWSRLTEDQRRLVFQYSLMTGYDTGALSAFREVVRENDVLRFGDGDIYVRKNAEQK